MRQRERNNWQALNHPYIASILGVVETNGWLVMELYTPNLKKLYKKRQKPLEEAEVAHLVRQICEAVDFMHEKNILHRCN